MTATDSIYIQRFFYDEKIHKIILLLLAFLLYANTLGHEFVLDDGIVITENKFVKKGISGIPELLTKDSFYGFFKKEGKEKLVAGGRYRPMSLIFFAGIYQLFGADPQIYHFFSILLYGLLGILIYITFKSLLPSTSKELSIPISFIISLLFITHPVHTECIANIKGIDETMALLFSISALYFALSYTKNKNISFLLLSGFLFLIGLLSKENAISYLFIIPITLLLVTKQEFKSIVPVLITLLLATVLFIAMRSSVLGFNPFTDLSKELMNNPFMKFENGINRPMNFSEKAGVISYTLFEYIRLLLFPHPLTHDYYPKQIPVLGLWSVKSILAYIIYAAIIYFAWMQRLKNPLITLAAVCFILPLGLVCNILFPIGTNMGERFIFMPSLGFCILVAYFIYYKFQLKITQSVYILAPLMLLYSIKTILRNPAWHDNNTLFQTDVKVSKNSAKIHNGIAGVVMEKITGLTDSSEIKSICNKAKSELDKALSIHPQYMEAHLQLGNVYYYTKNYEAAINQYNIVLKNLPEDEDAFKNLQFALRERGRQVAMETGNVPMAKDYLKQSLGMNPEDNEARMLMGIAEGSTGHLTEAVNYFQQVINTDPKNAQANFNLGITYKNMGQIQRSDSFFNKAFKLDSMIYLKNGINNK